ncbi:MAG: hypothetical protein HQ492_01975 [Woeseiaceae bacterium]|nr:hypothetical protein [Woeseiaceae bacterium]
MNDDELQAALDAAGNHSTVNRPDVVVLVPLDGSNGEEKFSLVSISRVVSWSIGRAKPVGQQGGLKIRCHSIYKYDLT